MLQIPCLTITTEQTGSTLFQVLDHDPPVDTSLTLFQTMVGLLLDKQTQTPGEGLQYILNSFVLVNIIQLFRQVLSVCVSLCDYILPLPVVSQAWHICRGGRTSRMLHAGPTLPLIRHLDQDQRHCRIAKTALFVVLPTNSTCRCHPKYHNKPKKSWTRKHAGERSLLLAVSCWFFLPGCSSWGPHGFGLGRNIKLTNYDRPCNIRHERLVIINTI